MPSELSNISVDLSAAYERGKVDINFFAALCMPEVCISALPLFYIAVWQIISNGNITDEKRDSLLRFALGLPRGQLGV